MGGQLWKDLSHTNTAATGYKCDESPKKQTSKFAINVFFSPLVSINALLTYINETALELSVFSTKSKTLL